MAKEESGVCWGRLHFGAANVGSGLVFLPPGPCPRTPVKPIRRIQPIPTQAPSMPLHHWDEIVFFVEVGSGKLPYKAAPLSRPNVGLPCSPALTPKCGVTLLPRFSWQPQPHNSRLPVTHRTRPPGHDLRLGRSPNIYISDAYICCRQTTHL